MEGLEFSCYSILISEEILASPISSISLLNIERILIPSISLPPNITHVDEDNQRITLAS